MKKKLQLLIAFFTFTILLNAQTIGDTFDVDNITYEVTAVGAPNEVTLKNANATLVTGNVLIASTVTDGTYDYSVTAIGRAFEQSDLVTSIVVPSTVVEIQGYAFLRCDLLASVTFESPSSLTTLAGGVFRECPMLTTLTLPASLTTIGDYGFEYASLTELYILSPTLSWNLEKDLFNNTTTADIDLYLVSPTIETLFSAWTFKSITVDPALTLSTDDLVQELNFSIYPNPTTGIVNINSSDSLSSVVTVSNLLGRTLMNTTASQVDLSNFDAGVYLIKVKTANGEIVKRVIKQ